MLEKWRVCDEYVILVSCDEAVEGSFDVAEFVGNSVEEKLRGVYSLFVGEFQKFSSKE